ncbi:hypothetical protein QR680_014565 [Steinernema hermaphroditum]|uniref:Uncharacterized protein n=1 Tax=Steinernema hermaphroditum TaxID=289476 RepID=A0AA39IBL9_9BILA|nr:hypothetical protein QR680_014565 [Steinernema hermaphroditum]
MSSASLHVPFDECPQLKKLLNQYDSLQNTELHPRPIVYNFDEIDLDTSIYNYLPRNVMHPVFSSVMTISYSTANCSIGPVGIFVLYLGKQDESSGKLTQVFGPFPITADKEIKTFEIMDDYESNEVLCGKCNCLVIRKHCGTSWKPTNITSCYKRDQIRQPETSFAFPEDNSIGWICASGFYVLNMNGEFLEMCNSDGLKIEELINRVF